MRTIFSFLCLCSICWVCSIDVWIDCDPSVGISEVDDGYALWQAFRTPEIRVRGVSSVFGNAPLDVTHRIAQELVAEYSDLIVSSGASSAAAFGQPTQATLQLSNMLRQQPLVIIILGPATNIASLLHLYPSLAVNITSLVGVAGRRPHMQFSLPPTNIPFPDLNYELDRFSFAHLLQYSIPISLAPWEVSSKVFLTSQDIASLPLTAITSATPSWLEYWRDTLHVDGFNPFDCLAVGLVTMKHLYMCDEGVATAGEHFVFTSLPSAKANSRRVEYCYDVSPVFKSYLLDLLRGGVQT